MTEYSYDEILDALSRFEANPEKLRCIDVAPEPDQMLPNVRVYLYTNKASARFMPVPTVGPAGHLCNVCYKYRGFETRKVKFEVHGSAQKVVFGKQQDLTWSEKDIWLVLPRKSQGQRYFIACTNKAIRPATTAVAGDEDNLICKAQVPTGAGTTELALSAAVTLDV